MTGIGGLYVIIDPDACRGRDPVEVARLALEGGATMLQWRDKTRDKGLQLPDAVEILRLCAANDVRLMINDHADLALVLAARGRRVPGAGSAGRGSSAFLGVHVGQKDLPVADVRRILPPQFIVGASTNNVDEARRAAADGAGYIAVGDLFGTASKEGTRSASPQRLAEIKRAVEKPVIGIGGINATNVRAVMAAGADGVAVISAVCSADDPRAAATELRRLIDR
jgi:thiamine monophosphate synthase